jgi:hypothetical protein
MNEYDFEDDERGESIIWLAFWCNEGLEGLINVSEYINSGKKELFNNLKTGEKPTITSEQTLSRIIESMAMRARFNPQRYYEIYTFTSDFGMNENDIKDWFNTSPQSAVDWVRKNGTSILTKTAKSTKPIID